MGETPDFTRLAEELARLWENSMQQRRKEEQVPGFLEKLVIRQGELIDELSRRLDSLERELLEVRIRAAEDGLDARNSEKEGAAALEKRLAKMEEQLRRTLRS